MVVEWCENVLGIFFSFKNWVPKVFAQAVVGPGFYCDSYCFSFTALAVFDGFCH